MDRDGALCRRSLCDALRDCGIGAHFATYLARFRSGRLSALAAFDDNILDRLHTGDRTKLEALENQSTSAARTDAAVLQSEGLFFNRGLGIQMARELSSAWHSDVCHLPGREITPPNTTSVHNSLTTKAESSF